ncbi:unnamed protein product, partial [Cladocopium goreaui]
NSLATAPRSSGHVTPKMLRWVCVLCILHGAVQVPSFLHFHRGVRTAPRRSARRFFALRALPLQQAVEQLPPDATLRLPPGRHANAEPIVLRRNITLEGFPGSEKTELESCIVFEEGAERAALRNLDIINSRRFAAVHVRCSGAPEVSASTEGDHRQTTDGGRRKVDAISPVAVLAF